MRFPEFVTQLATRLAPVSKETIQGLNIQLSDYFTEHLKSAKMKADKNSEIEKEAIRLNGEIEHLDPHTPEFQATLNKISGLADRLEKKTIWEKTVEFLEKPFVKIGLLVLFFIITRWISRKITERPDEQEKFDEQPQYNPYEGQRYGYGYPPFYPPYPPTQPFNGHKER